MGPRTRRAMRMVAAWVALAATAGPVAAGDHAAVVVEIEGVWDLLGDPDPVVTLGRALPEGAELRCGTSSSRIVLARYDGETAGRVCGAGGKQIPFVVEPVREPNTIAQRVLDAASSLFHRPVHPYAVGNSRGSGAQAAEECVLVASGRGFRTVPPWPSGLSGELQLRPLESDGTLGALEYAVRVRVEGAQVFPRSGVLKPGLFSAVPPPDARVRGAFASLGTWALVVQRGDPDGIAERFEDAAQWVRRWQGVDDDTRRTFLRAYLHRLSQP